MKELFLLIRLFTDDPDIINKKKPTEISEEEYKKFDEEVM